MGPGLKPQLVGLEGEGKVGGTLQPASKGQQRSEGGKEWIYLTDKVKFKLKTVLGLK